MHDNRGKTYLSQLPEGIPEGQVLVHNVVWPRVELNSNGFRTWLQKPTDRLEPCRCAWASELGEHYGVEDGFPSVHGEPLVTR